MDSSGGSSSRKRLIGTDENQSQRKNGYKYGGGSYDYDRRRSYDYDRRRTYDYDRRRTYDYDRRRSNDNNNYSSGSGNGVSALEALAFTALSLAAFGIFLAVMKCCGKMCKDERPRRNNRTVNPDTGNEADLQQTVNTEKVDEQQAHVQQTHVQQNVSAGDATLADHDVPQVKYPTNQNDTGSIMSGAIINKSSENMIDEIPAFPPPSYEDIADVSIRNPHHGTK